MNEQTTTYKFSAKIKIQLSPYNHRLQGKIKKVINSLYYMTNTVKAIITSKWLHKSVIMTLNSLVTR